MTAKPTTDAIWAHLSSDLRRFIRRRVSDEHAADDLLQETFVRVHRTIGTLRETERLAAWVYQIARNVVIDHHRRTTSAALAILEADVVGEDNHQEPLIGTAWMDAMIQSLPGGYREAVQLAEIDGLTQKEVAERLGLSLTCAKSRVQRGRAMLKDALEECCSFEVDGRGQVMGCDPKPNQKVCRDCGE